VQAAEDLVLCAMVRSAITAALGLPLDALPGSHPTAPRPSPPTFNSNPQQPAGAPSQRPQPMATAQAARPPSYMTTATVTAFGAGGGINTAPRLAGQQASSVNSLTALIGQPLPPASHPAAHPTSTAALSPATAAVAPVSAQSTSAPAVATAPTATVATMATSSTGTDQTATGNASIGVSRHVPAVPQASIPQMPPGASAVATAATAARSSATASGIPTMSAAALSQPPTNTAGVQLPSAAAAPQLLSTSAALGGQSPQPGMAPLLATVSAALPGTTAASRPMPSSSNVLLAPTVLPTQPSAAAPQAARAFAPAARAGSAGVGPGQGAGGTRTAAVGEDVWQLASDVMAAGGTATTAAAVTTAAQQVQLANMIQSALVSFLTVCRKGCSKYTRRCTSSASPVMSSALCWSIFSAHGVCCGVPCSLAQRDQIWNADNFAMQAKKRSASDCRARFLMLVRARQAALAPQIYHRLPPTPPPAAARPSALAAAIAPSVPGPAGPLLTAAATVPFHPSATAAPQPMAVAAHMQHPPTASLQIASALAGQPSHPVLQPPSSSAAVHPAVGATAAWQPAAVLPVVATAAVAPAPVAPQLTSAQAGAQTQSMQSSQPAVSTATVRPSGGQTASGNLPSPGNVSRASVPINTVPSLPMAASAAASSRQMGPLASLLPGQFAAAVAAAAAADTTAVPGRGRGVQLGHKASLDVLRLKLRLVDLVQGSAALQPKVSWHWLWSKFFCSLPCHCARYCEGYCACYCAYCSVLGLG